MNSFNVSHYVALSMNIFCRVERFFKILLQLIFSLSVQFNSIYMKTITIGGKVSLCLMFVLPINSITIFTVELEINTLLAQMIYSVQYNQPNNIDCPEAYFLSCARFLFLFTTMFFSAVVVKICSWNVIYRMNNPAAI